MKEVYDISLRGISFKIEKDAYDLLDNYLVELKGHYGEQEAEVVNDIEERIAELLLEKGCANSTVVQYHHIDDIIRVLGRPSEIEESSGEKAVKVKKGIFRDTRNGVVAGVCSGLGAYFNLDAVWVRVIFILLAVVFTAPSLFIRNFLGLDMGWFGFLLLVYCILWLIIPEARTVSQRCAMRGESQSVDHIHRKFAQGAREVGNEMWQVGSQATGTVFSTIWRVICFTAGVLLTVAGFAGIVTVGVGFIGVDMIAGISALSIPDFIELNIGSTLWLKIFGVL
ncbi:MAG: PspC domain-containing protein, partial [Bacteroidales bacterium]|nr:PspC domain-containing protein [Bacteroidales bacterium]